MSKRPTEFRTFWKSVAQQFRTGGMGSRWSIRRQCYATAAVVAGVVALYLMGGVAAGDRRLYHAGTLSLSHRFIENECSRCHVTWGPVARLWNGNSAVGSVDEQRCVACHAANEHFVPASQLANAANESRPHMHHQQACAECHREHQDGASLTVLASSVCTDCHADLGQVADAPKTFANGITAFASTPNAGSHPEFAAVHLSMRAHDATVVLPESRHGVTSRLEKGTETEGYGDRAHIRFNHKLHLDPLGVLNERGEREQMQCIQCHAPDGERRYMLPIQFENHCQRCHGLYFEPGKPQQLPHESPEVVLGFLRQHFSAAAVAPATPQRLIPGKRFAVDLSDAERAGVDKQVGEVTERLRTGDIAAVGRGNPLGDYVARWSSKGGCAYCHEVTPAKTDAEVFAITPPKIPDRWLPHSEFRHDSHRELKCDECHYRRESANRHPVASSELTSDVLLPSIDDCRRCHASNPVLGNGKALSHSRGASERCVECHRYHTRRPGDLGGSFSIDEALLGRTPLHHPPVKSAPPE